MAAAYYLLGYAVECGLKACAAKQFQAYVIPEKSLVIDFYSHRFDKLLNIAGIRTALEAHATSDPAFQGHWNTVADWTESSRYDHSITEKRARDMLAAVSDPTSGVLPWLKTQW